MLTINLRSLYNEQAKLSEVENYIQKVLAQNVEGQEIVLTGQAPIWLYLIIAHTLHGKAKRLIYESPVSGKVVIFDHNPF